MVAFRSTRQFFNGHTQEDFESPDNLGIDSMSHFLSNTKKSGHRLIFVQNG